MLRVGEHTIEFVPTDLFRVAVIGDVSTTEGLELMSYVERYGSSLPHVLILNELSRAGHIPASVRKHWAESAKKVKIRGSAMLGASFPIQVLARMFQSVVQLFADPLPVEQSNPMHFFKTEAEALAWLEERRRSLISPGS